MSFWRSVHADFSEIDTSQVGTDVNLNDLTSFDLKDIINDDHSLTNTDYINNNFEGFKKETDAEKMINKEELVDSSVVDTDGAHKNRGIIKCNSCDQTFENVVDLNIHLEVNHVEKKFEEFIDVSRSPSPKIETKPKVTNKSERPKNRYPCIVCKKKFAEKSSMKAHVKETHLRHVVLCNVCGKRLFQDRLLRHEEEYHKQNL